MTRLTARALRRGVTALSALVLSIPPAVALNSSATAGTTTLGSGTWLATPVLTATSTNTQTSLSINSLNKKNNTYFWVRNYGTFALQSFTIAQVVAPTGQSPTVEIHYCSGTWDVMKDLCSGTLTVLLSTGDGLSGSALVPIAIPVGGSIELAAHPTKNGMATTISANVSRANIRAARTSHA